MTHTKQTYIRRWHYLSLVWKEVNNGGQTIEHPEETHKQILWEFIRTEADLGNERAKEFIEAKEEAP